MSSTTLTHQEVLNAYSVLAVRYNRNGLDGGDALYNFETKYRPSTPESRGRQYRERTPKYEVYDKAAWDTIVWEQPDFTTISVGDKPTFKQMVHYAQMYEHWWKEYNSEFDPHRRAADNTDVRYSDQGVHHDGDHIYTGGGIAHLMGLIDIHSRMAESESVMPNVIMRSLDFRSEIHIPTAQALRDMLDKSVEQSNMVHNAKNRVRTKLSRYLYAIENISAGLPDTATDKERYDARETAKTEYDRIIKNYEAELKKAMKELETNAISDDFHIATQQYKVLMERELAIAQDRILDAVGTRSRDMHPSCREQRDAMTKASEIYQRFGIAIAKETTVSRLTTLFDAAKAKMRAIEVEFSPVWYVGSTKSTTGKHTVTDARTVTVSAETAGKVLNRAESAAITERVMTDPANFNINLDTKVRGGKTVGMTAVVKLTARAGIGTHKITLRARNLCGPSDFEITFDITE